MEDDHGGLSSNALIAQGSTDERAVLGFPPLSTHSLSRFAAQHLHPVLLAFPDSLKALW